jgi:hypothetical protein
MDNAHSGFGLIAMLTPWTSGPHEAHFDFFF